MQTVITWIFAIGLLALIAIVFPGLAVLAAAPFVYAFPFLSKVPWLWLFLLVGAYIVPRIAYSEFKGYKDRQARGVTFKEDIEHLRRYNGEVSLAKLEGRPIPEFKPLVRKKQSRKTAPVRDAYFKG